ncbi:MAG: hypothetical protein JWN48_3928 [Myxococcaceae bacterium]|nr:hypothetical protein [Myxococcaceae bacterium]
MTKTLSAAVCVVLGALLPGCSEQPAVPTRQQGLQPGEELQRTPPSPLLVQKPEPKPAPRPPPSSLSSPFAKDPGALIKPPPQAGLDPAPALDAGSATPLAPTPSAASEATTPRDLPSELIKLLGQPADCLDLAAVASAGGRTTISITVSVMPSGRIIRATASAPNQAGDALRCLENRASAGNFRGPVPAAPRDVTATIPIEVVAQPGAQPPPG